MAFLPISYDEMKTIGWDVPDFIFITGDAYVDHPSFGIAIISRVLEEKRYKIVILSQPNYKKDEDFLQFGKPKLGFLISAGNIDSMVAHYTAALKKRSNDEYTPGGKAGKRPDYAASVYSRIVKKLYPDSPVILGGLEASLRRFAHYDYWSDCVKPSILMDSSADILVYGMAEKQIVEIADRLKSGENIKTITDIRGTCIVVPTNEYTYSGSKQCPSYEIIKENKKEYAKSARIQQDEQDYARGKTLIQKHGSDILIQNPPMEPLSKEEFDRVYALPYERKYHPSYEKLGGVSGLKEVEFSITHNRGCFGACAFCSIAFHQGRYIISRSKQSVINEAKKLALQKNFKGYIHDIGGPTANFRNPSCENQEKNGLCKGKRCLAPTPCKKLKVEHSEYFDILKEVRKIPKVKKIFIRSGIRYDYLLLEKDEKYLKELIENHVSGQLKVAPEHCSDNVLDKMGKPHIETYKKFAKRYYEITKSINKEQYLVPYFMSSHPGSTLREAIELALFLKKENIRPEQVQDFYPTPGTISTAMYYTGLDPYTLEEVYVPKTKEEKAMQRALLQYYKKENREIILKALKIAKRLDLIGNTKNHLINANVIDIKKKTGENYGNKQKISNKKSKNKSR